MNPIHHDEEFARAAGFSAPVCVGMLQASAMHAWAACFFGPENVRRAVMRWQEPLFPGDEVVFTAAVTKKYEEAGECRIDVDLAGTKSNGKVAVSGSATYVVAD
jgi:acyl dehydratase